MVQKLVAVGLIAGVLTLTLTEVASEFILLPVHRSISTEHIENSANTWWDSAKSTLSKKASQTMDSFKPLS